MKIWSSIRFALMAFAAIFYFAGAVAVGVAATGSYLCLNAAANLGAIPQVPYALGVTNGLGTLAGTMVIRRALELTFLQFPLVKQFSMGFKELDGSVESANLGQPVVSRILVPSTVSNFDSGASAFNATDVNGVLRNWRQIHHEFNAAEIQSTDRNLVDEAARPMAIGLAQAIVNSLGYFVSRQNFNLTVNSQAPTVTVASGWSYANTVVPLMGALDERGVPNHGTRFFLAKGSVNQALLVDPLIIASFNNPANGNAIATGKLPEITSGLRYDKFIGMPNTDSNLLGFAGTPDALMYMARAPKTPDEIFATAAGKAPFAWGIITDENSGFSVLVQQWITTGMKVNTRISWLDGYGVGNANNLVRLVSAVVTGTSGTITGATVTNAGYGYVNSSGVVTAPDVAISGGGGTGATATATVDTVGAITAITITAAGSGYTTVPTITITPTTGGRSDGIATASLKVAGYA